MPYTASPFRYPGGKTQLYNFVEHLLELNDVDGTYVEPFAGGAGLPIKLLFANKVHDVWINDYDEAIYSVWFSILNKHDELIKMIKTVPFDYHGGHEYSPKKSIDFWHLQKSIYSAKKNEHNENSVELAFATLFLNRTNRSGIINGGPIGGFDQSSATQIYARFNKQTLINKINTIYALRARIRLTRLDALEMATTLNQDLEVSNSFVFFDPPYYEQGKNLYFSSFDEVGHSKLATKIMQLNQLKWITTYDKAPQISDLYSRNSKNFEYDIRYSANNKKRGKAPELMFASPSIKIESFDSVNLSAI